MLRSPITLLKTSAWQLSHSSFSWAVLGRQQSTDREVNNIVCLYHMWFNRDPYRMPLVVLCWEALLLNIPGLPRMLSPQVKGTKSRMTGHLEKGTKEWVNAGADGGRSCPHDALSLVSYKHLVCRSGRRCSQVLDQQSAWSRQFSFFELRYSFSKSFVLLQHEMCCS